MSEEHELLRKYLKQRSDLDEGPVVLEQEMAERLEPRQSGRVAEEQPEYEQKVRKAERRSGDVEDVKLPAGLIVQSPTDNLFSSDPLASQDLDQIAATIGGCDRCRLCEGRTNTVPGEGAGDAQLVVVGEGPGAKEDETGRPFVGRAGELLTDILKAIDLERESVFICNTVKCRPPSNRPPRQEEIEACVPYLYRQLEIVRPKVILAMGSTAVSTLLQRKQKLGLFRGRVHSFRGMSLVATYHPAALLRDPNWKRPTWDDVRIARRILDE